jgi:hypothetical protein
MPFTMLFMIHSSTGKPSQYQRFAATKRTAAVSRIRPGLLKFIKYNQLLINILRIIPHAAGIKL